MIRIAGLNKTYNPGRSNAVPVLRDISLELPDKGMVAIFGRSGCGKTTLLNVLGGLDRFDSGEVSLSGEDIRRDTDALRGRMIGYIFQNYNLNREETVYDNVADALRLCGMKDGEELEKRVLAALRNVDMERFLRRKPDTLSGGQQQRVAIARAIVKNPAVILADEPTGNLDEANTVRVMELLRAIAGEHLVVLVTHEKKLVDYYCDAVIELSDGRIKSIRRNDLSEGYASRSSNRIFLGDLVMRQLKDSFAVLDYYGDLPEMPVHLKLVRQDGKLYIKSETPGLKFVDESSEVQLLPGNYRAEEQQESQRAAVDMSALPPVEGTGFGKLFSFGGSVRRELKRPKKEKKKNRRFLRRVMILLAAVLVLTVAHFGISVRELKEVDSDHNQNVAYVLLSGEEVAARLSEAVKDPDSGIDSMHLIRGRRSGDEKYSFIPGYFESEMPWDYISGFYASGVMLPARLAGGLPVLAGTGEVRADNELVLSSAAADQLLRRSGMDYLRSYADLIGICTSEKDKHIVGVVESAETALYVSEMALARSVLLKDDFFALPASDVRLIQAEGQTAVVLNDPSLENELPETGDTVFLHGIELTVSEIIRPVEDDPQFENFYYQAYYGWEDEYELEPVCWSGIYYLLNDKDYIRAASQYGRTETNAESEDYSDDSDRYRLWFGWYAVLHLNDPEAGEALLARELPELMSANDYEEGVITPSVLHQKAMEKHSRSIRLGLCGIGITAALLCLCMYFMMRASLMGRIKEVGIYRAIGVRKGNLLLRFSAESFVLAGYTVLTGYLFTSLLLLLWQERSELVGELFYYPLWLALLTLALLFGICLFFGTVPAALLLRKTPSEILAKYDI